MKSPRPSLLSSDHLRSMRSVDGCQEAWPVLGRWCLQGREARLRAVAASVAKWVTIISLPPLKPGQKVRAVLQGPPKRACVASAAAAAATQRWRRRQQRWQPQ